MNPVINCDLGESWPMQTDGRQRRILSMVELANVCCGAHAGDEELTRQTMFEVAAAGVRAGAHPGYPDPVHFGRRQLFGTEFRGPEVVEMVAKQVAFAVEAAAAAGLKLYHVKPHGALYNEAASDGEVAEAIAMGVSKAQRDVFLIGLAGSVMVNVFRRRGFVVLRECFADRRYTPEGLLIPRSEPGAMIVDPAEAREQIARLSEISDTVCVHGDSPGALDILEALSRR